MASSRWRLTYKAGDIVETLLWSENEEEQAWYMASCCCSELYDRLKIPHNVEDFELTSYFLAELRK